MKNTKTIIKVAAAIVALAVFTVGGYYMGMKNAADIQTAIPKESMTEAPLESPGTMPDEPVTYITRSTLSAVADGKWETSDSYTGNITSSETSDTLNVYYSADSSAEQTWVAEVKTSDGGYYTLVNQSLTNGRIYAELDELKGGEKCITLILSSQSGVSVKRYTYSESGFKEERLEGREGARVLYSSLSTESDNTEQNN